jgi:hypothetical protein
MGVLAEVDGRAEPERYGNSDCNKRHGEGAVDERPDSEGRGLEERGPVGVGQKVDD